MMKNGRMEAKLKQLKTWVRSQHLICVGTDFILKR